MGMCARAAGARASGRFTSLGLCGLGFEPGSLSPPSPAASIRGRA